MKYISGLMLILFSLASQAQPPSQSPEQTIRQIYSAYTTNAEPDYFSDLSDKSVLSARMKAALLKDQLATLPGDIGALDADPLCACQDYENLVLDNVAISQTDNAHADAAVRFRAFGNAPESRSSELKIKLIVEKGRWLVDDVISEYGSTLQKLNPENP